MEKITVFKRKKLSSMQQQATAIYLTTLFIALIVFLVIGECGGGKNMDSLKEPLSVIRTWDSTFFHGNVTATLKNDRTLVIKGTGRMFSYNHIISLSHRPWSNPCIIKTVVIGEGLINVGSGAFEDCADLVSVTIPASVTEIEGLTGIGGTAFRGCVNLMSIDVAEDNTRYSSLDGVLFNKTKDTLLYYPVGKSGAYTVPRSVVAMDNMELCYGCVSLTSIDVAEGNTRYSSLDGVLFNKAQDTLLRCPPGKQGTYTIPSRVKHIRSFAFSDYTRLTSIIFQNPNPVPHHAIFFGRDDILYLRNKVCLYVPANSIDAYRVADGWKYFKCVKPIEFASTEE